jgi:hypothetical protein
MKQRIIHLIFAAIGIFVSFAVLLSGVHAKDLPALSQADKRLLAVPARDAQKVASEDGSSSYSSGARVVSEYHNHIDKQTLKSLLDNGMFSDQRNRSKQDDRDVFDEVHVHWLQEQLMFFQIAYAAAKL